MNKEETLGLFAQGKDAWNAWADQMVAERKALEKANLWNSSSDKGRWNSETRDWYDRARADFSNHLFDETVDFSEREFPGDAKFDGAIFSGDAWFGRATFSDEAWFGRATFSGYAVFEGATFSSEAWFEGATFSGYTWFGSVVFLNNTAFDAIEVNRAFSLADTTFETLPSFVQAHFSEAPRLDNLRIEPRGFLSAIADTIKSKFKSKTTDAISKATGRGKEARIRPSVERSAKWRALKRLAIQGHDHSREQEFFKGELKARRWVEDKPWHAALWFGYAYQWLSDFGRSMVRPLVWFAASIAGFAALYLRQHEQLAKESVSVFSWVTERLSAFVSIAQVDAAPACIVGSDNPVSAAILLSLRKAFLFLGGGSAEKLNQVYGCLYGVTTAEKDVLAGQFPSSYSPIIPNYIVVLELGQQLVSAVLIFLFLLAVRNHFRIK